MVDGVLCEFKSALLSWIEGKIPHYKLKFAGVMPDHHKDRYLAWMSPSAVHIWKQPHGNTAGLGGNDASQVIQFYGPKGRDLLSDPTAAEAFLLKKFAFNKLEYLARLDFGPGDFARYQAAIA